MDRTTYDHIFLMLLNGDLLLRYGFIICEEDADTEEEPDGSLDQYFDYYHLIGLKENPAAKSKHSGKGFASWVYASTSPMNDYSSHKWKDELVEAFKNMISGDEWQDVLYLAGKYENAPKHFHNISNIFYGTT